jgi:hypothetical protein
VGLLSRIVFGVSASMLQKRIQQQQQQESKPKTQDLQIKKI